MIEAQERWTPGMAYVAIKQHEGWQAACDEAAKRTGQTKSEMVPGDEFLKFLGGA